ncbi:uncharacterized protein LMH87_007653 [Akanthomyces muscarius]|uniref:Thaumatin-like protein n=1 Tax=Akanthomyces muscarius TaxID=2231603 RepID=A0A9W8QKL0_AKAMU|nr:uncharacterized protein LMH87_007653 [Akanthomyces muscarius]KAJ4161624.1 hypothetical protein LMH87_007653 [Akanthomyces muscarius]
MLTNTLSLELINHCPQPVWPAIAANSPWQNAPNPLTDTSALHLGDSRHFSLAVPWSGRIWGDCGRSSCWNQTGKATTLFEFDTSGGQVSYDISLVDALTLGMKIIPANPACPPTECDVPAYVGSNANGVLCPASNLIWRNGANGNLSDVLGCNSDCTLHTGVARFCCEPGPEGRKMCSGANPWFKTVCPNVYTYASDDETGMKACSTDAFKVIFTCPQ